MGRKVTLLDYYNVMDIRVVKKSLDDNDTDIHKFVDIVKELQILDKDKPYVIGLDHANETIEKDHYHVRGWTKCSPSNIVTLRKRNELLKNHLKGNKHLIMASKEPIQKTINEFFRYAIKDEKIYTQGFTDEWLEANIPIARAQYEFKLKEDKKKEETRTLKEQLNDYLDNDLPISQMERNDDNNCNIVGKKILQFALEKGSTHYMRPNTIRDFTYLYLFRHKLLSHEHIYDKMFGYGM